MKTNSLNNRSSYFATLALAGVALFSFGAPSAKAGAFTSGNLVVLQSDGTTSAATTLSLLEFTTSGTAQTAANTVTIPSTVAAAPNNAALTQSGSATSEGFLSRSQDGRYLLITGYNAASGTTTVASGSADRVVGRIDSSGNVDTTTRVPGISANNIRTAVSDTGSTIYVAGAQATCGIQSVAFGAQPASANVITAANTRYLGIFGSQLYAVGTIGTVGTIGSGLPTSTATYAALSAAIGSTGSNQFYFLDRDSNVAGVDQCFVADGASGIKKYSFNGTAWSLQGTISGTFFGLVIAPNGSGTVIYATTGTGASAANTLVKYTDSSAYNATASFSTATTLATAATGKAFRGLAFAPVSGSPTPTITGAATASAFTTTYGTASTAQTFTVGGSNLSASITATAPTGFEVSSDGTTYGTTATFTQSGGTASGSLRVRLAVTATPGTSYDSKNIVLSSTGASSVNITTASTGNTVSKKALTITGLTGASKNYTGTTSASVTGTAALSGFVGSDTATLDSSSASWTYATAAVGTAKTITASGYAISGGQSSYYTLTQPTSTADITARSLTITANNVTKAAGAVLTGGSGSTAFTSSGLQNSETIGTVTITYGSGAAADAAGGVYADAVVPSAATGGTFTASNYSISYVAGSITVNASPTITATGTLANVGTTYGTASATPTSFTVSGGNLTSDLSVAAPSGFEISTSIGSGYASNLTLNQSSGSVSNTTIYVRLAATTAAGTYSGNITVTGGGATAQNVATASSTVAQKDLSITGLSAQDKVYDGNNTASTTGTPAYSGLVNGDSFSVAGSASATFADANVGTAKVVSVTGITAPSLNYSVSPLLLAANITQKALTVASAAVTTKTYDGSNAAVVTGTLAGVVGSDTVNFSGTGTFADANAGTGIAVTSTSTISGAQSSNYSLTQPTGLTGDITKASQTITFGALANKTTADVPFALSATTTATGLTVSYASSNPAVATVSGSTVTIVGPGSTTITASQAGNQNYNVATSVQQTLTVSAVPTLTEVYVPQIMEGGMGSTNSKRMPYAFRVTLTNLNPSATYRYFNAAVIDADSATTSGAGNPIFVTDTGSFGRSTGGSLSTAGNYSTFTTDANGSYTGWFMLEPTGNATRFATAGTQVKMRITLNNGTAGNTTATTYLTTASYVTVTPFGTTSANGTAIRGASSASAKSFVLLYDNAAGTGRPLAATVVEGDGVANTTANSYASFYATNVDEQIGAWGTIIPNNLANGVRRIENRAKADGSLVAFNTDSDGAWASGVNTVNPAGGDTTPLVITSSDALLAPAIAASGTLSSLSTTYGTPSTSTQFSVSGANLREGILVTAPSSYEVSTDNSTFSSTVTVGSAGTIASTIVYVRLSAAATVAGSPYAGNIQLTSSGAASVNVATVSSTVAPQSISDSITLTPTGDGSYTASASGGVTFTYSYAGRTANGYATSYSASATAAAAPGYYTVTATSSNPNYTGSKSVQYFIEGLVANGRLTKPTDNQPFVIEQAGLLAKISRITSDGSLVAANLPVGSVATVTGLGGSSAQLDGTDILFTPTSSASDSVRVGISGFSELVTIAVSTEGSAPTFTLQIVKVGTAVYSSGNTTMTNDFIGVPNQSYAVEYSMDLTNWVSAGSVSTGATGSFSVTLAQPSDVAATWNRSLFFRAKISAINP